MQSAYCNEFASLNGNYGYKLEVPPMHPGMMGSAFPWYSARSFRGYTSEAAYAASFIVLTRDKGEGHITLDRDGEPEIHYTTSVFDRQHLTHGLRQAARIHFAAGATRVLSLHAKPTLIERQADGTVSERQWRQFDIQLERHGMGPNRLMIFSAHQMGTCRMGADPRQSVIDGTSQVHGVEGLFVCDGSVFPAPSGTNPMLSIMGLAHRSAQYIKSNI
jgi:choline dehydrogenase-like flavoprotein